MGAGQVKLIDPKQGDDARLAYKADAILDAQFASKTAVSELQGGHRAQRVELLAGGVVAKRYDMADEKKRRLFWHEVAVLTRLADCPHVAHLLHADAGRGVLYLEYVGENAGATPKRFKDVKRIMKEIEERWGVLYARRDRQMLTVGRHKNGIKVGLRNVTVDSHGRTRLIDFGGPNWKLAPLPSRADVLLATT
jgi:hypothetical protein